MSTETAEVRLRRLAKQCAATASERVGDNDESLRNPPTDSVLLALIAAEALDAMLEADLEAPTTTSSAFDSEAVKDVKRLRKILRRRLDTAAAAAEPAAGASPDLGQYATARDALGNEKRVEKFARLLGGAKASRSEGVATTHATYAATPEEIAARQAALQAQFEDAAARRGKLKGLGK